MRGWDPKHRGPDHRDKDLSLIKLSIIICLTMIFLNMQALVMWVLNFFGVMNLFENLISAMGLLSLKIHIQIFR